MPTQSAESLAKGLRLLTAILADGGRSNLAMLAQSCGIPLSTAHRLLVTLESAGFVIRSSRRGQYLPGPALDGERQSQSATPQAAARLRRPLRRLAERFGVFAHFGVLEEGMVTYLLKENPGNQELFTAEQMQLEAYCSAIGKVLLAALPEARLDHYLANGPFVALTRQTLTDPDAIRREIETVRDKHLAFDRFEIRDDLFCLAVPVRDHAGLTVGGISASFVGRMPEGAELAAIRRTLRRIARDTSGAARHRTPGSACP